MGEVLPGSTRIAITGIRDLCPNDVALIQTAMLHLLEAPRAEIRFGGARGTDTVALETAGQHAPPETTLSGIVPGLVSQQPAAVQEAIRKYAGQITEMCLPLSDKTSFQRRNIAMIAKADGVLALAREAGRYRKLRQRREKDWSSRGSGLAGWPPAPGLTGLF